MAQSQTVIPPWGWWHGGGRQECVGDITKVSTLISFVFFFKQGFTFVWQDKEGEKGGIFPGPHAENGRKDYYFYVILIFNHENSDKILNKKEAKHVL